MSAPLYEVHLFRTTVPHRAGPGIPVQFPVMGIVLVPASEMQIDGYVEARMRPLAPLRLTETKAVRATAYTTMLAGLMTPAAAYTLSSSTSAIDHIPHVRPARTCKRCQLIAETFMSAEEYSASRDQFDIMCGQILTALSEQSLTRLERRLNSPGFSG